MYRIYIMIKSIKAIVFDMDGVLRIGNQLILGADNILVNFQKQNIQTMIVTNECRYTPDELREDLEDLGLQVPESTVIYTAALSARDFLQKKISKFPTRQFIIGIVGELGLYKAIYELQQSYDNCICIDTIQQLTDIYDQSEHSDQSLLLIIGTVNKIKINHLDKILKWIQKGAKVITTCMDACDPSSKGDFTLGMPNHMLHMVGYNIQTKPYSTGKPHPIFKDVIINSLSKYNTIQQDEILFVGDTIYTDIRLAEENGFKSCLVLSGNSNVNTPKSYVNEPDLIVQNVVELQAMFK